MILRFASFLGDNGFEFYRQVVAYLGAATGLPTEMVRDTSAGMDALFANGMLAGAFGCGLLYVRKAAESEPLVRLLAAPVMSPARYGDRPVYFSDVIVRHDSPFHTFDDLRGATFAYNEEISLSGYVLPRYHWQRQGEDLLTFFGALVKSGSHARSMDWVQAGRADCAAIDSVVLEMEFLQRPARRQAFRIVAGAGPATMPPVMASAQLDPLTHEQLAEALTGMHLTEAGRAVLQGGGVRRFARVTDSDYDDIRHILKVMEGS
ncbi:MAG: PhnD/SsuA/transferrin family substrate-binding protein [Anaerolineales bacterium]|nr:PhnD/SsuA/transferrin family substrate-binding protein [Anaerolineales bacterium]